MDKPDLVSKIELGFRNKRAKLLNKYLKTLKSPIRVLDVGGTMDYWRFINYSKYNDFECTLLNIEEVTNLDNGFKFTFGDACDLSIYRKNEFDLVFSNSVINLVGNFERQKKMANEVKRVGKCFFVQVPNKYFPIDWRTLVPFFHFLPIKIQAWFFRTMRVGLYRKISDYKQSIIRAKRVRDLTKKDLIDLFPEASIIPETVFGITKSYIVHFGFDI